MKRIPPDEPGEIQSILTVKLSEVNFKPFLAASVTLRWYSIADQLKTSMEFGLLKLDLSPIELEFTFRKKVVGKAIFGDFGVFGRRRVRLDILLNQKKVGSCVLNVLLEKADMKKHLILKHLNSSNGVSGKLAGVDSGATVGTSGTSTGLKLSKENISAATAAPTTENSVQARVIDKDTSESPKDQSNPTDDVKVSPKEPDFDTPSLGMLTETEIKGSILDNSTNTGANDANQSFATNYLNQSFYSRIPPEPSPLEVPDQPPIDPFRSPQKYRSDPDSIDSFSDSVSSWSLQSQYDSIDYKFSEFNENQESEYVPKSVLKQDSKALIKQLEERAKKLQSALKLSMDSKQKDWSDLDSLSLENSVYEDSDFEEELKELEIGLKVDKEQGPEQKEGVRLNEDIKEQLDVKESVAPIILPARVGERVKMVSVVSVQAKVLELLAQTECPLMVWIEYTFPTNKSEPYRFREKLSAPFRTPKIVTLSHKKREPIVFTPAVLRLWETGSIDILVTALGPKKEAGKANSKLLDELWSARGEISCKDVLLSENMKWSEEVALTNTTSKKKFDPKSIIGHLRFTLELLKDEEPGQSKSATIEKEPLITTPVYFYFDFMEVKGLQINSHLPQNGTLLNLSFRLFNLDRIQTVPIKWNPEFDPISGLLSRTSFNFQQTVPVSLHSGFMNEFAGVPVVIEIRYIVPGSESERVLGVVRLPFPLVVSVYKGLESKNEVVQLPMQEYPIIDPLCGKGVGWVTARLAIGPWHLVSKFAEESGRVGQLDRNELADTHEEELLDSNNGEVEDPAIEVAPEAVPAIEDRQETNLQNDLSTQIPPVLPSKSESVFQITIHRACGLLGLLDSIFDERANEDYFEALDFASQTGVNSFCSFELFPSDSEEFTEDTVQTQMVAYSFTPQFEYSVELTIESLDTELILWIKKGGCAKGKLWHRIARHFAIKGIDKVCLGEFSIPLIDLLSFQSGICRQWFPVGDFGRGAIECSLVFKNGFDLGGLNSSLISVKQPQDIEINLNLSDINVYSTNPLSKVVIKWRVPQSEKSEYESEIMKLFEKGNDSYFTTVEYVTKQNLHFEDSLSVQDLELRFFNPEYEEYLGSCYVNISKLLRSARAFRRSRNSKLGEPIFKGRCLIVNPESADLGNSFVNIKLEVSILKQNHVLQKSALMSRRSQSPKRESLKETKSEIDSLIKQAELLTLEHHTEKPKIEDSLLSRGVGADSELNLNELLSEYESKENNSPLSKLEQEYVPLYITIERAMHLPLVKDPLANSLTSPFVKKNDLKTTPPTASVSFICPSGFKEKDRQYSCDSVHSQTCPIWSYKTCVHAIKTRRNLVDLKESGAIKFSIWDTVEIDSDFMSNSQPRYGKSLLGSCQVALGPLFTGLNEINGWYTIQDQDGFAKGELMVKILPVDSLADCLTKFGQETSEHSQSALFNEKLPKVSTLDKNDRAPLEDRTNQDLNTWNSATDNNVPFLFMKKSSMKQSQLTEKVDSSSLFKKQEQKENAKPEETWVWNGKEWEHRVTFPELDPIHGRDQKIISDTIEELDSLNQNIMAKFLSINEMENVEEAPVFKSKLKSKSREYITVEQSNRLEKEDLDESKSFLEQTTVSTTESRPVNGEEEEEKSRAYSVNDTIDSNPFLNTTSVHLGDVSLLEDSNELIENLDDKSILKEKDESTPVVAEKPPLIPAEFSIPWKQIPKPTKSAESTGEEKKMKLNPDLSFSRINNIFYE